MPASRTIAAPIAAIWLAVAFAVAFGASRPAAALDYNQIDEPDGRITLEARGIIMPGDFHRLLKFLDTMAKVQRMKMLLIDSPGGFVNEAEKMAVTINNIGLPVAVPGGATCASACVLLLAAAPHRQAGEGARIGVHRASSLGKETRGSLGATDGMTIHFEAYGMPRPLIEKMRATPPGTMTWLTPEDLALMRVAPLPRSARPN